MALGFFAVQVLKLLPALSESSSDGPSKDYDSHWHGTSAGLSPHTAGFDIDAMDESGQQDGDGLDDDGDGQQYPNPSNLWAPDHTDGSSDEPKSEALDAHSPMPSRVRIPMNPNTWRAGPAGKGGGSVKDAANAAAAGLSGADTSCTASVSEAEAPGPQSKQATADAPADEQPSGSPDKHATGYYYPDMGGLIERMLINEAQSSDAMVQQLERMTTTGEQRTAIQPKCDACTIPFVLALVG